MAAKQIITQGKTVKKSNALARARWSPDSVWEPRIVAILASMIRPTDTDFQTYEIRLVELVGENLGGENYKKLETAVDRAMGRIITIRNDNGWKKYTLFSSCELDRKRGILKVGFHPDLREHYLQLKQYMKYSLVDFMLLPSIYSQRIFEILKSWDDRKEVTISLSDLHEMLGTPKSFIGSYKDFRRFVLDKAHKDINEKTSLAYEWEPIKTGRAVSHIKFRFIKRIKQANKVNTSLQENKPVEKTAHNFYESFLQKFPNGASCRIKAGKLWHDMERNGKAPMAEDVPENNELGVMEFLAQWQEHAENKKAAEDS